MAQLLKTLLSNTIEGNPAPHQIRNGNPIHVIYPIKRFAGKYVHMVLQHQQTIRLLH